MLAIINKESIKDTTSKLWSALQASLILPQKNDYKISLVLEETVKEVDDREYSDIAKIKYKFLHDRVQQAAYSLIDESERKLTHLKIGKLLLHNTTSEAKKENIFAIVNQLNLGVEFILDPIEKHELAQLNLIAGEKAKLSAAYASALSYLRTGIALLSSDSWTSNYQLTLSLYLLAIEVEYLNGNFVESNNLAKDAFD